MLNEIKKAGFSAWIYRLTSRSSNLPKSLCKFSWVVLAGILLSVINIHVILVVLLFDKNFRKFPEDIDIFGIIIFNIIFIISTVVVSLLYFTIISEGIILFLILIGIGFLGTFIIISVGVLFAKIIEKGHQFLITKNIIKVKSEEEKLKDKIERQKRRDKRKTPKWIQIISDGFRAYMEKNCPKINWID